MPSETQKNVDKIRGVDSNPSNLKYPIDLGSEESGYGHWINFRMFKTRPRKAGDSNKTIDGSELSPKDLGGATAEARKVIGTKKLVKFSGDIINLYMPENITTSYGMQWENDSIQTAAGLGILGDSMADFFSSVGGAETLTESGRNMAAEIKRRANEVNRGDFVNDTIQTLFSESQVGNSISAFYRELRNPHMEFLFRGINPRQFNLEFKFTPRNARELQAVYDIIKKFKMHMHPELSKWNFAGNFYRYPSEFVINFFSYGKENKWMHKYSNCALTDLTVNYTGAGQVSMFEDFDGKGNAPTHINLSLQFMELELLTSERIKDGY